MARSFEIHPAANIFPVMSDEEYRRLRDDIAENGQRECVVFWKNKLLDGRNRMRACEELGIEAIESELEDDVDPIAYVISANLHRRQLKTSQRAMCAAKMAGLPRGTNQHTKEDLSNDRSSAAEAATLFNVGTASVSRALEVLHDGCAELVRLCELGELSVSAACKFMEITTKPVEKKIAKHGAKAIRDYMKAQAETEDGPVSDDCAFIQFKAIWDAADEVGRAAIRAFVLDGQDDAA